MKSTKRRLAKIWSRSWIVTLPIVLVFGLWARGTYSRWEDFTVRHRTSQDLNLLAVGELEAAHLLQSAKVTAGAWDTGEKLAATGLDTVHLFVKDGSRQRLDSNLPHSGFEYVEGGLFHDGQIHEVDLRYRGDNVYHWGYWKKSWRVKTKRGALYKGMRKFNLVAPRTTEVLNNYLSYRLGSLMGLISPKTELVNVALNGENLGVFVLTEQLEESTIRRHDKMPGDVYSGELVGMDSYQGIENKLFDHPGVWSKVAINNHFDEGAMTPLEELIRTIEEATTEEGQRRLSELVDMEAFGRFSAFETLVCTVHIDAMHNWRLYYDPWATNFVPIVWDPVGWHRTTLWGPGGRGKDRPDVLPSPLHAALFRNADFLRARANALAEFFESGTDQTFLTEARDLVSRVRPALDLDPHHVTEVKAISPAEVEAAMKNLIQGIAGVFEEIRQIHTVDSLARVRCKLEEDGVIGLEVQGRRPVEEIELRYSGPVKGPLVASLRWSNVNGQHVNDVTGRMSITGSRVVIRGDLISRHQLSIIGMAPSVAHENGLLMKPARYDLVLAPRAGSFEGPADEALQRALGGALVGVRYRRTGSDAWESADFAPQITSETHGRTELVVQDDPGHAPIVVSGELGIEGNKVIENDVIIAAGTRFRMKPFANLLFKGRVFARGTAEEPILFEPFEEGMKDPWGVVAIKGAKADGSSFAHCHFREGSGWKRALAEYSAMFSIHSVQDLMVTDCSFKDSRTFVDPVYGEYLVDDMVHGVYSSVTFRRCDFRRSFADALDMDISTTSIEECLFFESGNDSVDLMTAKAMVSDSRFIDSGDKGISVGEDSELVVLNTLFDTCVRGIESKDKSVAIVLNSDFNDCTEYGVNAYNKNWRYTGGGTAYIYKSRLKGNVVSLNADRHSRIVIGDSSIDEVPDVNPKRIVVEPTVGQNPGTKAADPKNGTLPLALKDPSLTGRALVRRMDAARRGSTLTRGEL